MIRLHVICNVMSWAVCFEV